MADDNLYLRGELELNVRDAERKVDELQKSLDALLRSKARSLQLTGKVSPALQSSIDSLKKSLEQARGEANRATRELNNLGDEGARSLSAADSAAGGLIRTLGAVFSLKMAKDFAGKVMSIRGEFQQLEIAFETILGSKDKADKMMADAVDLAAKTPFDLQGVAAGAKSLLAYGMESDKVIDSLRRLGDVAAGLSLPLGRLTAIYGQTMVKGKLQTRDLIRYQAAGIPILDELAKMYGKTTNQVREMVTAGKVGFADVEKVFVKMTSEGGKFANLMEKQSASITGRISNIQDAIDEMFNEIGKKSEGVIYKGLDVVASLVENYEKVGVVLASIAATYGVAKAASMAYLAVTKASLVANAGYSASLAKRVAISKLATVQQKALNAAIKASPYVLAAAAVAALAVQLHRLSTDTSAAAKAQEELKARSVTLDSQYTKEISTLKRLKGQLENAEVGSLAWNKAKGELVSTFGKYNSNLSKEVNSVDTLTVAYKKLTASITESAKVRNYSAFLSAQSKALSDEITTNLTTVQKRLTSYFGEGREDEAGALFSRVVSFINGDLGYLETSEWDILNKASGGFMGLNSLFNPLNTMVINAQKDNEKLRTLTEDAAKAFGITAEMLEQYSNPTPPTVPNNESATDKELRRKYNLDKKAAEQEKKLERERAQMKLDERQRALDLQKDSFEKTREQNQLNFDKEMEDIKRQREDRLKALQDAEMAEWQASNPNRKEWEFKSKYTELPQEWMDVYAKMEADAKSKLVAANAAALDEMLKSYRSYADQRHDMEEDFQKNLAQLEKTRDAETNADRREEIERSIEVLKQNYVDALYELDKTGDPIFKEIFADPSKMTSDQLKKALISARNLLNALKAADVVVSEEKLNEIEDVIIALGETSEMMEENNSFSIQWGVSMTDVGNTLAQIVKDKKKLAEASTNEEKKQAEINLSADKQLVKEQAIAAAIQAVINGLSLAADKMKELADASGDVQLGETAEQIGALAQNLGAAAQGAASGGWVGAIVGGVSDILNQTIEAVMGTKTQTAIAARNARDFRQELELAKLSLDSINVDTIFGNNNAAYAQEAWKKGQEALGRYNEELAKLTQGGMTKLYEKEEEFKSLGAAIFAPIFGWGGFKKQASNEYLGAIEAMEKGYNQLEAMQVKTKDYNGWANFWGKKDEYTALKDLAPEIWNEYGEIEAENLRVFLDTNQQLNEGQRNTLENIYKLKSAYDEAMKAVEDYAAGILGDFGKNIGDVVVDSILSGKDAFKDLEDVGLTVIDNLAREMASSFIMSSYLEGFQKDLVKAFGERDNKGVTEILGRIMEGLPAAVDATTSMVQDIYKYAEEAGFDIDQLRESTREASSKGIAQASQDTVDELNGRFAVIQSHTFQINESVKAIQTQNAILVASTSDILEEVRGIHSDTIAIRTKLDDVLNTQGKINSNLGWVVDKGVRAN